MAKEKKQKKRGQGEGSIYKRKDGLWVGAVNLGYKDGKLKRKVYYGKTRSEVANKLTAALADQQKGIPIITERQTVGQFLSLWLNESAKPSVKPKTLQTYTYIVDHHIIPALGSKQLAKLEPSDVQQFINDKLESGLSAKTVRHINDTLRAALNVAVRWQLISRNVATLVTKPRIQKKEVSFMTPEQAQTFLDAAKGDRLETLFTLALYTGLRQGELLALRWQDINLEAGILRVTQTLQRLKGRLYIDEPKTEKSRRNIELTGTLVSALRDHRSYQNKERLQLGPDWQDSGLVFTSNIGTPLEPRNVVRKYYSLLEKAKLPHFRFHDLRHSCASLLLANGVPPRTVMEILGHSQFSLTMNTYAHVIPGAKRKAISLMDTILKAKSK